MMKKLVLAAPILLLLASCAGLKNAYVEEECNPNAARTQGMRDARYGKAPKTEDYSNLCPEAERAAIIAGYNEGYESASPQAADNTPVVVNITTGKGKWTCDVTVGDDEFSAQGSTELKTKDALLVQCKAKHGDRAGCEKIKCTKN